MTPDNGPGQVDPALANQRVQLSYAVGGFSRSRQTHRRTT